jgi:3-hydroxyisobutyrate dehydrogenase-like beta-hydroxyacid dehydrogenase
MSMPEGTTAAIGIVGLGTLGDRIAERLLSRGYTVYGHSEPGSAGEVVASADVIFSVVSDTDALEEATAGPDGILAGLSAGKVYVDLGTVSPEASNELAGRIAARGASMLAAPVPRSLDGEEEGRVAIIVGGDADAFERVEPILRELGGTVTFVGERVKALLLNLAINVSHAVQALGLSEGARLAEHGGVDRTVALDVLKRSAIGSPMLRSDAPPELPDKAWFDVLELLGAARVLGYEHRDIAVLFQTFSEMIAEAA